MSYTSPLYPLFKHLQKEFNWTFTEDELYQIARLAKDAEKKIRQRSDVEDNTYSLKRLIYQETNTTLEADDLWKIILACKPIKLEINQG